jgi:hypothetical protein
MIPAILQGREKDELITILGTVRVGAVCDMKK